MILELYMKNCALVEELRLGIDENLNILTGEQDFQKKDNLYKRITGI